MMISFAVLLIGSLVYSIKIQKNLKEELYYDSKKGHYREIVNFEFFAKYFLLIPFLINIAYVAAFLIIGFIGAIIEEGSGFSSFLVMILFVGILCGGGGTALIIVVTD